MASPNRDKYTARAGKMFDSNDAVFDVTEALKGQAYLEIAKGDIPGYSLVHKFGAGNLDTTLRAVSNALTYKTPIAVQELEVVSSDADDTAAGAGAQEITVVGLNANWEEVTQTKELAGATPVILDTDLIRVYRWYVSRSGTYATDVAGSHQGILTLRESGAGTTWDTIPITPFPLGQSQIGVYTVPAGKTAYLLSKNVFTDTTKTADVYFYQRTIADDITTPFTGTMRLIEREVGAQGGFSLKTISPKGPFVGPCDIGFMGKVSNGTAECSVEFELLLIDNV